jgi:exosome complex component CSL4
MEGIIRKINVRQSEVDKIQMDQCFLPGDIVKARVVSYGDSRKIFLGTAENDLGVIFAFT